jgi:TPP-dependent pyruvate/acetoin dehydrogenase alpha subunit
MGDGATSEPDVHSAMTFAAVSKAPAIFVCQNNQWAITSPTKVQFAAPPVSRAEGYGMPGVRVDGNDILAVYAVMQEAHARAIAGEGPTFVEAVTYRMTAHSTSDDPTRYRDEAEVEAWRKKDPIGRFRAWLTTKKLWDDAQEAALQKDILDRIEAGVVEVEGSERPGVDSMFDDIFESIPAMYDTEVQQYRDYLASIDVKKEMEH